MEFLEWYLTERKQFVVLQGKHQLVKASRLSFGTLVLSIVQMKKNVNAHNFCLWNFVEKDLPFLEPHIILFANSFEKFF